MKAAPKTQPFIIALVILTLVLSMGACVWLLLSLNKTSNTSTPQIQNFGEIPDFTLTTQDGKLLGKTDLKGKVWIADFIFTRCASACPFMTGKMKELNHELTNISFVSFSVDPKFDTPEILKKYTQRFQIESSNWNFLTGPWETLSEVSKGFKVTGTNEPMFHSQKFVLVDREGIIRGYFDPADEVSLTQLREKIASLK